MSTAKHLINVLFLGALCASFGFVCAPALQLSLRVAELELIVDEQLVVVDANGTLLGDLAQPMNTQPQTTGGGTQPALTLTDSATVMLDAVHGFPPLALTVWRDSLAGTIGTAKVVYFSSPDCSGTPHFPWDDDPVPLLPLTMVKGGTIFYSDVSADSQTALVNSYYSWDSLCHSAGPGNVLALPGFRASLPFTPPYSVVTRGELAAQ